MSGKRLNSANGRSIRLRKFSNRIRDDTGSQNLRQHLRAALSRRVQRVRGNATAIQCGQRLGNRRIALRPVRSQQCHMSVGKCFLDFGLTQCHTLIDLAAQAPLCRKVHKHGPTLRLVARNGVGGPWLPGALSR